MLKNNIRVDWFFGEAFHGRGLIDAMAWFGCKGPIRKYIIVNDSWYRNAGEMVDFLKEHFKNDPSKAYHLIDEKDTARERSKGRAENPIWHSSFMHVISFFSAGTYKAWTNMKNYFDDGVDVDVYDNQLEEESDNEKEADEEEIWDGPIETMEMFNLIEVERFVAIRAPANSLEMFFIMKVSEKGIAEKNMMDNSEEHCVLKGEPYLMGKWISFQNESKKVGNYKESKTIEALIHVSEVFLINIPMNDKLQMDIHEYRMLCCSSF